MDTPFDSDNFNTLRPERKSSTDLLFKPGALVGGFYVLDKRIGSGGFGEVWRAHYTHGNVPKAIKIITRLVETKEAEAERQALDSIKSLNHPGLLRTEGFFIESNRLVVVMELAEGSLRDFVPKLRPSDNAMELLRFMTQAASAIDFLHEGGVIHCDIKPENILFVGRSAKVTDFGLAMLANKHGSISTDFRGTLPYVAPETWKGRISPRSDQYSLAITYAEMRLSRRVIVADTIEAYMKQHLETEPNLAPLPSPERKVLLKALAKKPAHRFDSCVAFTSALQNAVMNKSTPINDTGSPGNTQAEAATQQKFSLVSSLRARADDEDELDDPGERNREFYRYVGSVALVVFSVIVCLFLVVRLLS